MKVWAVILLLPLMTLSSCGLPYCIKSPFSDEDLGWMRPYSVGDTLIFKDCLSGYVDTVIIREKTINDISNTSIFDLRGCNWMEADNTCNACAYYDFDAFHSGVRYEGSFILHKEAKYDPAEISITIFDRSTKESVSSSNTISYLSVFPNYKDIILIESSNIYSGKRKLTYEINAIYWSKDVGLIGYRTPSCFYVLKDFRPNQKH